MSYFKALTAFFKQLKPHNCYDRQVIKRLYMAVQSLIVSLLRQFRELKQKNLKIPYDKYIYRYIISVNEDLNLITTYTALQVLKCPKKITLDLLFDDSLFDV